MEAWLDIFNHWFWTELFPVLGWVAFGFWLRGKLEKKSDAEEFKWECPHCEPPEHMLKLTGNDQRLLQMVALDHINKFHPEVKH